MPAPTTTSGPNLSPIRIYVLWHPDMDKGEPPSQDHRGLKLARRIYHWFRMENMEGIPVYFRSASARGSSTPPPVRDEKGVRNYIIALVDANMVASPDWRGYLSDLADRDPITGREKALAAAKSEYRFLPVAMEPFAYNLPKQIRGLNFIRHMPRGEKPADDFELLAKITDVLCRDLRHWLHREAAGPGSGKRLSAASGIPGKIKIFLSHAKADDIDEAIAIKEYIQRETQCEAFFDETDIASGYDFTGVLETAITQESAGLIVLQGDNYADRPWCRKEIRDFLTPSLDPIAGKNRHEQYAVAPIIVVQTMKGRQMARTIPELGYSPCLRWQDDRADAARFVVTTLLREICFGLFYRALARRVAMRHGSPPGETRVYLNRSPDPVTINRIIAKRPRPAPAAAGGPITFVHPGYGLSKLEYDGLTTAFPEHKFRPFLDRSYRSLPGESDLSGLIIAVSVGNPGDVLEKGLWEEHMQELLVRMLRPLLQSQASLLYGGDMPKTFRHEKPWEKPVNFTAALLQLLLGDRETGRDHPEPPRLFVPIPCHRKASITAGMIAQWSDVCSFVHVPAADSGISRDELAALPPPDPEDDLQNHLTEAGKRRRIESKKEAARPSTVEEYSLKARGLSAMRRKICDSAAPLTCELPDPNIEGTRRKEIRTLAHILIGGKTEDFSGIMPGIFEEALHAFDAKPRKPVFIVAEYGGAAALLASWLASPPEERPAELDPDHYGKDATGKGAARYEAMLTGFNNLTDSAPHLLAPATAFDRLWRYIDSARHPGGLSKLLNNGHDDEANRKLLTADSSGDICRPIWEGIRKLAARSRPVPLPRPAPSPKKPGRKK